MRTHNTLLAVFTKPYALLDVINFDTDGVVVSYQNSKVAQEKTAEVLFGAIGAKGKLPVTANAIFPVNTGIRTKPISRLGYSIPERVGLDSKKLAYVDTLVKQGLDSLMFPGAQVLIAGCTELPLVMKAAAGDEIVIDPTEELALRCVEIWRRDADPKTYISQMKSALRKQEIFA